MATTYTAVPPRPAGVPAPLLVRIVVMREDGKPLSREELEALYQKVGMFGQFMPAPVFLPLPGFDGFMGEQIRGFGFLSAGDFDTIAHFMSAGAFSALGSGARVRRGRGVAEGRRDDNAAQTTRTTGRRGDASSRVEHAQDVVGAEQRPLLNHASSGRLDLTIDLEQPLGCDLQRLQALRQGAGHRAQLRRQAIVLAVGDRRRRRLVVATVVLGQRGHQRQVLVVRHRRRSVRPARRRCGSPPGSARRGAG